MSYRPWTPVTIVKRDDKTLQMPGQIYTDEAYALKALGKGQAMTPEQQTKLFNAILHICGMNDLAYYPDGNGGDRDSAFAAGKQFVGHQLLKILRIHIETDGDKHG